MMEVTIRVVDGVREPKADYLPRIMQSGSRRAKVLKLADRISNITSLGVVHDLAFVRKYLRETRDCLLPHAEQVNADVSANCRTWSRIESRCYGLEVQLSQAETPRPNKPNEHRADAKVLTNANFRDYGKQRI